MVVEMDGSVYRAENMFEFIIRPDLMPTMAMPQMCVDDEGHLIDSRFDPFRVPTTVVIKRLPMAWYRDDGWIKLEFLNASDGEPIGRLRDFLISKEIFFPNPESHCFRLDPVDLVELELSFNVGWTAE